eukprot:1758198-Amphidinium_carterae.5
MISGEGPGEEGEAKGTWTGTSVLDEACSNVRFRLASLGGEGTGWKCNVSMSSSCGEELPRAKGASKGAKGKSKMQLSSSETDKENWQDQDPNHASQDQDWDPWAKWAPRPPPPSTPPRVPLAEKAVDQLQARVGGQRCLQTLFAMG